MTKKRRNQFALDVKENSDTKRKVDAKHEIQHPC